MATNQKIPGHLICPYCKEMYKNPKRLPCYHSYCEKCIGKLQATQLHEGVNQVSKINCQVCSKTSSIPSEGPKTLPSNFFINRIINDMDRARKIAGEQEAKCTCFRENNLGTYLCIDCSEFLCNLCYDQHKYTNTYVGHEIKELKVIQSEKENVVVEPQHKIMLCKEHKLEKIFFCETCNELTCPYCVLKVHQHHKHDTVTNLAAKHRANLELIMTPVEEMMEKLDTAHQKASSTKERIVSCADEVDQHVDNFYEHVQQLTQQQKQGCKKQLHDECERKKKEVSLQLDQLENVQTQFENVKVLDRAIRNGFDEELLFMKKQIENDVNRLKGDYQKLKVEPVESANMKFGHSKEFKTSLPQFGHLLYDDAHPNHTKVYVPKEVPVGRVSFTVLAKDSNNRCAKNSIITVQAQQKSGDVIPTQVNDNEDGSYTAYFVANQSGEVKVSITIQGKHINGSPYNVTVLPQHSTLNRSSKTIADGKKFAIGRPWGIAFGNDSMWAVSDDSKHCVHIFNAQDQLVTTFGYEGNGCAQFYNPSGLAFDANNHLYVVDKNNHRVQKFDISGKYMLHFGRKGRGSGLLNTPIGITAYDGKLFVVDQMNNRVSVFQTDGQYSAVIGTGNLNKPVDVKVADNCVLVADNGHHCISVFSAIDGSYMKMIGGTQGANMGQLAGLCCIAVDLYGFIFVTEETNHRVSIFDKDGIFIQCFGSSGTGDGQFSSPKGIAFSPKGNIYVCDYYNRKIHFFSHYY